MLHRGRLGCQAHHADQDWAQGGNTNVDDMTLACGPDNRAVDDGGWQTHINTRGECEWTPPPDLDHGQARINYYHRPKHSYDHPRTRRYPIRNHRDRVGTTLPTSTRGT